jgi:hypothetical protein
VFLKLVQTDSTPIANIVVIINSTNTLDCVEKWSCRPSLDDYDYSTIAEAPSTTWNLFNDCDTARTQISGTYYFGFHCAAEEGCAFSYNLLVHSIESVSVGQQSSTKPILRSVSHQYFQVVPTTDSFDIVLQLQAYVGATVTGAFYYQDVQAAGCASVNNFIGFSNTPVASSSDDTFVYWTYSTHISPVSDSLIGRKLNIAAYITADCNLGQSCGFYHLELPYADDPISYGSQPVTYDTPITYGTQPVTYDTQPVTGTHPITDTGVFTTDQSTAVVSNTKITNSITTLISAGTLNDTSYVDNETVNLNCKYSHQMGLIY